MPTSPSKREATKDVDLERALVLCAKGGICKSYAPYVAAEFRAVRREGGLIGAQQSVDAMKAIVDELQLEIDKAKVQP